MASLKQFRLPDVGEGLTEAEIVHWHVEVGDAVTQNQTIVDIETAKALVELPSPFAGVVSELLVPEGTTVDVGTPIIIIDVAADVSAVAGGSAPVVESTLSVVPPVPETGAVPEMAAGRTANLVGYGPRADSPVRRRQRQAPAALSSRPTPSWPSVAPCGRSAVGRSAVGRRDRFDRRRQQCRRRRSRQRAGQAARSQTRPRPRHRCAVAARNRSGRNDHQIRRRGSGRQFANGRAGTTVTPRWRGADCDPRRPQGHRASDGSSVFTVPHVTEFTTIDVTPIDACRHAARVSYPSSPTSR